MKHCRGQSMLEVMIGVSLLTVVILSSSAFIIQSYGVLQRTRIMATRDRLAASLTRLVGMPATLRASWAASQKNPAINKMLSYCYYNSTPKCDGSMTVQYPLQLFGPFISSVNGGTDFQLSGAITGYQDPARRIDAPVYYSITGQPCDPNDVVDYAGGCPATSYPFKVYTSFQAICPAIYDQTYDGGRGCVLGPCTSQPYVGDFYISGPFAPQHCIWAKTGVITLQILPSSATAGFLPYTATTYVDFQTVRDYFQ